MGTPCNEPSQAPTHSLSTELRLLPKVIRNQTASPRALDLTHRSGVCRSL